MTRLVHHSLGLFLAALLALTSVQAAVARGAAPVAGSVEICIGHTIVVIAVDSEGNPTQSVHLCPDISLSLFVEGAAAAPDLGPDLVWHRVSGGFGSRLAVGQPMPEPHARGPPAAL
jgi:hypothetical protein